MKCLYCSKNFKPKKHAVSPKFCSTKCRVYWHRKMVYGDGSGGPLGLKKLKEVKTIAVKLPEETEIKHTSYPLLQTVDMATCPYCKERVPTKRANQHYLEKHEGAQ